MGDPDAYYERLVDRLGLPFVGACWHLTDPDTGLFTWTGQVGELPGDFDSALVNEYLEDDVAKYAQLARRRTPVASLVAETDGEPERSARYRRHLAPAGYGDELRLTFADAFGRWGSLGLFAERPFTAAEVDAAARVVPDVARTLREAAATGAPPAAGDDAPGVLVLDVGDRVLLRDDRADELLSGCARTGALPGALHVLAARARLASGPAGGGAAPAAGAAGRVRRADGGWLEVSARVTVEPPGAVAVVLRPAAPASLLDVRLRAAGLTEREREIARALLRGEDTATIAAALHLSPWTVQDHLKAIFDKTGVRSRRAFVARWALGAFVA